MVHWSWDHQNPKALMLRPLRKMLQHRQTDSSIEDESDQLLVTASGQERTVPTLALGSKADWRENKVNQ